MRDEEEYVREDGSGRVVTSEPGLAHTGPVVDNLRAGEERSRGSQHDVQAPREATGPEGERASSGGRWAGSELGRLERWLGGEGVRRPSREQRLTRAATSSSLQSTHRTQHAGKNDHALRMNRRVSGRASEDGEGVQARGRWKGGQAVRARSDEDRDGGQQRGVSSSQSVRWRLRMERMATRTLWK